MFSVKARAALTGVARGNRLDLPGRSA